MSGDAKQDLAYRARRRGSVLMETVLAIPLFMIFIGGVIWLGDLMVTRQKLVIVDRYVAWNTGLRYPDKGRTDVGTLHRLFFKGSTGVPSPYHKPVSSAGTIEKTVDWSHEASGQVRLSMRMPSWIRSWFNAGQVFYDAAVPLEQAAVMFGRDKIDQKHVVLMRTREEAEPTYIRNRYGRQESAQVGQQWQKIADEKWPNE